MRRIRVAFQEFMRDDTGAVMADYALMVALIPAVYVFVLNVFDPVLCERPPTWRAGAELTNESGFESSSPTPSSTDRRVGLTS